MQRRAAGHAPLDHPAPTTPTASRSSNANVPSSSSSRRSGKKKKVNPVIVLISLAVLILIVSWHYFPAQVMEVEREAEYVSQELAQKAIRAEHEVEDWLHKTNTNDNQQQQPKPGANTNRRSSEEATARMMEQSSTWVDGEKKLKKKLSELAEKQQKGELLGVPVLTRWLGDDFPAWVTPDMDEEQWRKDVAAKYEEMRADEEEWKKRMQKIIEQRERDLGITTA